MGKRWNKPVIRMENKKLILEVSADKYFDEFLFQRYSEKSGLPENTVKSIFTESMQAAYTIHPELRKVLNTVPNFKEAVLILMFNPVSVPDGSVLPEATRMIMCSIMADTILELAYKRGSLNKLTKEIADFNNRIRDFRRITFCVNNAKLSVGSSIYPIETHENFLSLLFYLASKHIDASTGSPIQPDENKELLSEIWSTISSYIPSSIKKNAARNYRVSLGNLLGELMWRTASFLNSMKTTVPLNQNRFFGMKKASPLQSCDLIEITNTSFIVVKQMFDSMIRENRAASVEIFPNPELFFVGYFITLMENPDWVRPVPFMDFLVNQTARFTKYGTRLQSCFISTKEEDHGNQIIGKQQEDEIRTICDMVLNPSKRIITADNQPAVINNSEVLFACGLNIFAENIPKIETDPFVTRINQVLTVINPKSEMIKGALTMLELLSLMRLINPPDAEKIDAFNRRDAELEDEVKQLWQQLEDAKRRLVLKDTDINALSDELETKSRQYAAMEKTVDDLRRDKKSLQDDLDSLLETIGNWSAPDDNDSCDDTNSFPVSLNGRKIISFGGFPTFVNSLKGLLPDLNIRDAERRPDTASIVSAEAVFMQVNCMKHSDFYFVAGKCRENGIPMITYQSASARLCAQQVLDYLSAHPPL